MRKELIIPFNTADFLSDTLTLNFTDIGKYITILAVMVDNGRLTRKGIEVICRGEFPEPVMGKFKIDQDGLFYSEWLESAANKRKRFCESRKNSLNINNSDLVSIYLLFDPVSGSYKIGSSKFVSVRVQEARKKKPEAMLFWYSGVLVSRKVEKELHIEFKPLKHKNDWFFLKDSDIQTIKQKEVFRTR